MRPAGRSLPTSGINQYMLAVMNSIGINSGAIRQVLIGKLSKAKAKSNNQYYTFRIDESK